MDISTRIIQDEKVCISNMSTDLLAQQDTMSNKKSVCAFRGGDKNVLNKVHNVEDLKMDDTGCLKKFSVRSVIKHK